MSEEKGLLRKLSFWHVWAIGVGAVVGDGIFYLVGQGASAAGPSAILAYAFAGIVMMVVMMSMCELSVGMPSAESIHAWSTRLQGPGYGTTAALSYTAMNITFLGSVSIANGIVSNYFFQWTSDPEISAFIWSILLLTIVAVISLAGVGFSARTQLIMVLGLAGIMLSFGIIGVISGRIDTANYQPFAPMGFGGFMAATGLGVYAYMGPLALLTAGDEVKNPVDLPKAMFWAFIAFLVLYSSCMFVMVGLVNYTEFGSLESPFTYAAEKIFGGYAGLIMNFAAWLAAFTCLVGEMYCSSRLLYGMSLTGATPKTFSQISKTRVPWFAIVVAYLIAVALVLMSRGSGFIASFYATLCLVGCGLGVVCWTITVRSASIYKQKCPEEWEKLPWKLPAAIRPVMFPIAFIGCALTFYMLFASDPVSILWVVIAVLVLLAYNQFYVKTHSTDYKEQNKKTAGLN